MGSAPRRSTSLRLVALCVVLLSSGGPTRAAGELDALARLLALEPGSVVADVGAGEGEWSAGLATMVGPTGRVYATEVDEEALRAIRERVETAGLANVAVVAGSQTSTGLPAGCCDAILLRMVYHHFTDPAAMRRDLLRALLPGGRLVVVDIAPQSGWRDLPGTPERGGHGIVEHTLVEELTSSGFQVVSVHEDWNGDGDRYCVVLRRPLSDS